jgi:hypothetical protein
MNGMNSKNPEPELVTIRYRTPTGIEGEWKVSLQVCGGKDEAAKEACLKYWHPNYEYISDTPKGKVGL